jgi:RNA polymerase sigma factor (sigma-70 family)
MRLPGDSSTTLVLLRDHAVAGDGRALNALLEEVCIPIERFLRRRLTSPQASNYVGDVAQETLIRIARSINTCRAQTDRQLMAWVLTIARHVSIDMLRSNMMWYSFSAPDHVECEDTRADSGPDPRPPRADRLLRFALRTAQESLPDETQELLWHRLVLGCEWAEVATEMGTTEAGAKRRYQRAQSRLRKELSQRIYSMPARTRALVLTRLRQAGVDLAG